MRRGCTLIPVFAVFALLAIAVVAQTAIPSLGYVKQFDDGSYLITINGEQHWAVNLAKTKEIKKAELRLAELDTVEIPKLTDSLNRTQSDLAASKMNVQDERLRNKKIQDTLDQHLVIEGQCFDLLKHGGGRIGHILDNGYFRIGEDIAKTAVQMKRCR